MPWGLGGYWNVGDPEEPASSIELQGPDSEYPDDPYAISLWADWKSGESDSPYNAGEVVELTPIDGAAPVENPTVIFTKP